MDFLKLFKMSALGLPFISSCVIAGETVSEKSGFASENICPCPDFNGASVWECPSEYKIEPHGGMNGTAAVFVERTNPQSYKHFTASLKGLKKNTKYDFGVWVKSENLTKSEGGCATIAIEGAQNGKCHGSWPYGEETIGTKDWTLVKDTLYTGDKYSDVKVLLYLRKGVTGKAWFCAPYIREAKPEWRVSLVKPVMSHALKAGKNELVFKSFVYGLKDQSATGHFAVKIRAGSSGKTVNAPIKDNQFSAELDLPLGKSVLNLALTDSRSGEILLSSALPVSALDSSANTPDNAVMIDDRGRAWSGGKKFLPIGLYTNNLSPLYKDNGNRWRKIDTERIKNSPFNCIMPYDSILLRLEGSALTGSAAVCETMDEMNRNGIKVIFSLKDFRPGVCGYPSALKSWGATDSESLVKKAVETLRGHPALLAWYLVDETEISQTDLARRDFVSSLDPFHPTWQVQYQHNCFRQRVGASDVFGSDPYPIDVKNDSMALVRDHMVKAMDAAGYNGNIAFWGASQIMAFKCYKENIPLVYPSETQMRSMFLLMASLGARGFIMFSYPDLFKLEADQFERRWPEVCRAAQALRDLEVFLLSDATPPEMEIKTIKGQVEAKAFASDDGKNAVIITAIGPGEAEAEIKISGGTKLKSKYGGSTFKDGVWIFKGKDIDSDVLSD